MVKFAKKLESIAKEVAYNSHVLAYKSLKKRLEQLIADGVKDKELVADTVLQLVRQELRKVNRYTEVQLQIWLQETRELFLQITGEQAASPTSPVRQVRFDSTGEQTEELLRNLGQRLVDLDCYRRINYTGFRKILKKLQKKSEVSVADFEKQDLNRSSFLVADLDWLLAALALLWSRLNLRRGSFLPPSSREIQHRPAFQKTSSSSWYAFEETERVPFLTDLAKHFPCWSSPPGDVIQANVLTPCTIPDTEAISFRVWLWEATGEDFAVRWEQEQIVGDESNYCSFASVKTFSVSSASRQNGTTSNQPAGATSSTAPAKSDAGELVYSREAFLTAQNPFASRKCCFARSLVLYLRKSIENPNATQYNILLVIHEKVQVSDATPEYSMLDAFANPDLELVPYPLSNLNLLECRTTRDTDRSSSSTTLEQEIGVGKHAVVAVATGEEALEDSASFSRTLPSLFQIAFRRALGLEPAESLLLPDARPDGARILATPQEQGGERPLMLDFLANNVAHPHEVDDQALDDFPDDSDLSPQTGTHVLQRLFNKNYADNGIISPTLRLHQAATGNNKATGAGAAITAADRDSLEESAQELRQRHLYTESHLKKLEERANKERSERQKAMDEFVRIHDNVELPQTLRDASNSLVQSLEPKSYLANERNLVQWIELSVLVLGSGCLLLSTADDLGENSLPPAPGAPESLAEQIFGRSHAEKHGERFWDYLIGHMLIVLAFCQLWGGLFLYYKRAEAIRTNFLDARWFETKLGPLVSAVCIVVALVAHLLTAK
ncbi:unnamed protein product [Amoebophrya sp. A120]|nr:unnamed protein product [Amoebophrya sp. A120]|eukprot:GSA120T00017751001.1